MDFETEQTVHRATRQGCSKRNCRLERNILTRPCTLDRVVDGSADFDSGCKFTGGGRASSRIHIP